MQRERHFAAHRLARWVSLATCVLTSVTCESLSGPTAAGGRVPVGVTVAGTVSPGDSLRYSFVATGDGQYAVFLETLAGSVQLNVVDSQRARAVAVVYASPTSGRLLTNASQPVAATKGAVYSLDVIATGSAVARFDFLVYAVNEAPEFRPVRFSLGDTIAGETIDPLVDVDTFVAHGTAGQDIVVVAQPLDSARDQAIVLAVSDSQGINVLGATYEAVVFPYVATSGRIRLPKTGDYRFDVFSVPNNLNPRYDGPYRFWSYAINPAPEQQPGTVPLGSEVRGERIDVAGDVDQFTFSAQTGALFNAFVQASRTVYLEVAADTGAALAAVFSNPADTSLYGAATGPITIPVAGPYMVRVSGGAPFNLADTATYRFKLYPIDPRPERVSATIVPGDTVSGESIDVPGDIDEYPVPGAPGDEFDVFFQSLTTSPQTQLLLTVVDDSGHVLRSALSGTGDTSLVERVAGRFMLPPTGGLRLRVAGVIGTTARDTGAYRLRLYPVNRKPEKIADSLTFGDSVAGEAIDAPGDIDEFRVAIPDSSGANLVLQLGPDAVGGAVTAILYDSLGQAMAAATPTAAGEVAQSGTMSVGPGRYVLRVRGGYLSDDGLSQATGTYRLWLYRFGFGPETAPDTIVVGDTVRTEALHPPGDVDVFHVFLSAGQHVNLALAGNGPPGGGLFLQFGLDHTIAFLSAPTAGDTLGAHQTGRLDLTATGWYTIGISGIGVGAPTPTDPGPYVLALTAVDTLPEHVSPNVAVGDTVSGEAIDYPGDYDSYVVTGTPGQVVSVLFAIPAVSDYPPTLELDDPATGAALGAVSGSVTPFFTTPAAIPASGRLTIRVRETADLGYRYTGGYRFTVVAINLGPESVPATFALGDTVRGEAIFPAGDIDQFTSTATPGVTLAPFYRLAADPAPSGDMITLEIVDPATGAVLTGSFAALLGSTPDFFSPGSFVVPASGSYMVRVRAYQRDTATAPYEFYVAPVP